mmetsp:Transcript_2866/g.5682  ORF Transcript_2866/g.5682 Transcript_2866/m.5682 type:complete len:420 (-) Transcript_2866:112-1371(-)
MPWYIPDGSQTRSMTKTGGIFSKYRTIDSCAHFLLQGKKERKFKVRWPKKLQDSRPPYRIISRPQDQSRPPLKIAYSDDLESLRKVEWKFCSEKFEEVFPRGLSSSQQWKWTEAFFTNLAISSGAEVGEREEKHKEEKGSRPKEDRGESKEKQVDEAETEEKKKGFSAKSMMKNLRSVFKAKEKERNGKTSRSPSPSNKSPSTKSTAPLKSPNHAKSFQQLRIMDNSPKDGSSDGPERELTARNMRLTRRPRSRRRNSTTDLREIAQQLYNKDSTDENEVQSGENNSAMTISMRNPDRKLFRRKRSVVFRPSDPKSSASEDNDLNVQNVTSTPLDAQDRDSIPVCVLIPVDGHLTFFWMAALMASLMWFLRDFSRWCLTICVVVVVLMMFSVVVLQYPFALFVHIKVHRDFLHRSQAEL